MRAAGRACANHVPRACVPCRYLSVDSRAWLIPAPEPGFNDNKAMVCPQISQTQVRVFSDAMWVLLWHALARAARPTPACRARAVCCAVQFCRRNSQPIDFADDMRPSWHISPSYYHYLGAVRLCARVLQSLLNLLRQLAVPLLQSDAHEAAATAAGCRCQTGYTERRMSAQHGGATISMLLCDKSLSGDAIAAISAASSVVLLLLLAYCAYVSWYGRWGLPRLQRVSRTSDCPPHRRMCTHACRMHAHTKLLHVSAAAPGCCGHHKAPERHSHVRPRCTGCHRH